MRFIFLLIQVTLLVIADCPRITMAQPMSQAELAKQFPGRSVIIDSDKTTIKATGVGGQAIGADAKLDQKNATAPNIITPWGSGMGGSADTSLSAAASVYGSIAFRIAAGVVGLIALLGAYFVGRTGNLRAAAVYGLTGAALLLGTILWPEWLELGLLAFVAVHLVMYAKDHNLLTGNLGSIFTAVENEGADFATKFNAAVKKVRESYEAPTMNRIAAANGAKSVEV